jgi:hypothetical protein
LDSDPVAPLITSLIVFACVFGGALVGFALNPLLRDDHRKEESRDVLKLSIGLIGTMAALVLGLLVSSAKSSYDAQKADLTSLCADIIILDRTLAHYGPEAIPARQTLRATVERARDRLWKGSLQPSLTSEKVYDEIEHLVPRDEEQRSIKASAISMSLAVSQTRWLMYERGGSAVSRPLVVVVVFWLTMIFVGFGLLSHANAITRAALLVSALAVSGAIFLILEMDRPFSGFIRISDAPIEEALSHMGR